MIKVHRSKHSVSPVQHLVDIAPKAAPYELARLFSACSEALGGTDTMVYLADLQQDVLIPFAPGGSISHDQQLQALSIDSTMAGRAFQTSKTQSQSADIDGSRLWIPIEGSSDRLGVLGVTVGSDVDLEDHSAGSLVSELHRLSVVAGSLIAAKTVYGDTLVSLRRLGEMGLAAEIQWSLLPPLTFVSELVSVAAALEPAYHVAGDTIDYAIDEDQTRVAIFDVMGHGLHSAQCAVLGVAAYRNARRSRRSLSDTLVCIEDALVAGFGSAVFLTAVVAELDTSTGLFSWANAGHPEPVVIRGGRVVKSLSIARTPPLGLGFLPSPLALGAEQLEPGDRVLFYTDGMVDARAPDGSFFGLERLTDLVIRHLAGGLGAAETMRRVTRELLEHHQGPLGDDASIMLLEWRNANENNDIT